jgi:hypothetical protein
MNTSATQWLNGPESRASMSPASPPDLRAELLATRRELAAVRRVLLDRQAARRRPVSSCDAVRALAVVLQHSTAAALEELRAERDRLARDLASAEARRRTAQNKYSALRYNVWQIVRRAQLGDELPDETLELILEETADSEDDRLWEEGGWVE